MGRANRRADDGLSIPTAGRRYGFRIAVTTICEGQSGALRGKAADQFHTKTTRPNETRQTDFTCFKTIGWGWMYLSTVLDDFSRYVIAGMK